MTPSGVWSGVIRLRITLNSIHRGAEAAKAWIW